MPSSWQNITTCPTSTHAKSWKMLKTSIKKKDLSTSTKSPRGNAWRKQPKEELLKLYRKRKNASLPRSKGKPKDAKSSAESRTEKTMYPVMTKLNLPSLRPLKTKKLNLILAQNKQREKSPLKMRMRETMKNLTFHLRQWLLTKKNQRNKFSRMLILMKSTNLLRLEPKCTPIKQNTTTLFPLN